MRIKRQRQILFCSILLIQFGFIRSVFAAIDCSNDVLKSRAVHLLPGAGYWMQAAGNCRITYTSVGGLFSKMYNTCKEKAEPMTNQIDAFPLPMNDGELYVHPTNGISFYKMKTTLAATDVSSIDPIFSDPSLSGNYESIGLLKQSTPELSVIRIAMGNAAGTFRDYKISKNGENFRIEPVQDKPIEVCKNLPSNGLDKELPVLSRDGEMMAGRQYDSQMTEIFQIDSVTGSCRPIRTIPFATSKVSFNFDNKNVLYVAKDPQTGKGRLMQMAIQSGALTTLSGPDEDVMYMTSRPDGTVFYSRRGKQKSVVGSLVGSLLGSNHSSDFAGSDLVELDIAPFTDVAHPKTYEALGLMWADACQKDLDLDYALAVGLRLNSQNCKNLVTDTAVANLDPGHNSLTKEDLVSACRVPAAASSSDRSGTAQ